MIGKSDPIVCSREESFLLVKQCRIDMAKLIIKIERVIRGIAQISKEQAGAQIWWMIPPITVSKLISDLKATFHHRVRRHPPFRQSILSKQWSGKVICDVQALRCHPDPIQGAEYRNFRANTAGARAAQFKFYFTERSEDAPDDRRFNGMTMKGGVYPSRLNHRLNRLDLLVVMAELCDFVAPLFRAQVDPVPAIATSGVGVNRKFCERLKSLFAALGARHFYPDEIKSGARGCGALADTGFAMQGLVAHELPLLLVIWNFGPA
ncbi:MAG TPA: hypothetical protein VJN67_09300 [Stellaceae bacterium]|nr:hypothetical protein [Stellaceae bacterium]